MDRHVLSDLDLHRLSFVYIHRSGIVRDALDGGFGHAHHSWRGAGGHDVTAGHEAVNPVLSEIVGEGSIEQTGRRRLELACATWAPRKPQRVHLDAGLRLALVIGDAARNHAAAREREVDPIERLSLEQFDVAAGLERPRVAVFERAEPRPRHGNPVPPGAELGRLISAALIGCYLPLLG